MAQSHGMNPQEHAKYLFNQTISNLAPNQRAQYAKEAVQDFVQRVQYRSGEPIQESDIWIGVHAAEIFLEDLKQSENALAPSDKYLFEKFIEAVQEVATKLSVQTDLTKLTAQLGQNETKSPPNKSAETKPDTKKPSTKTSEPHSAPVDQSARRKPNIGDRINPHANLSEEVNLNDFKIVVQTGVGTSTNVVFNIFPNSSKDDAYIKGLKETARLFFAVGNVKQANQALNKFAAEMQSSGKSALQIRHDLQAVIGCGIDKLGRLISNPELFAQRNVHRGAVRNVALSRLAHTIRKVQETQLDLALVFAYGKNAFDFLRTDQFNEIAMSQLARFMKHPDDSKLAVTWDMRKIAMAVGNREVETLSAIAYGYYFSEYGSKMSPKAKVMRAATPERIYSLPDEILGRVALGDKTWMDVGRGIVPTLDTARTIQGNTR